MSRKHTTVKDLPEYEAFQIALDDIKLTESAKMLVDSGELAGWVTRNVAPILSAKEQLVKLGKSTSTLPIAHELCDAVQLAHLVISDDTVKTFADNGIVIQEVQQPVLTVTKAEAAA